MTGTVDAMSMNMLKNYTFDSWDGRTYGCVDARSRAEARRKASAVCMSEGSILCVGSIRMTSTVVASEGK